MRNGWRGEAAKSVARRSEVVNQSALAGSDVQKMAIDEDSEFHFFTPVIRRAQRLSEKWRFAVA